MNTNETMIRSYSSVLDNKYGKKGTLKREQFDENAYAFYTSQMLLEARKEAKITQAELAQRINSTKSYISKLENGVINPSAATFNRIIDALGFRLEIVKSL